EHWECWPKMDWRHSAASTRPRAVRLNCGRHFFRNFRLIRKRETDDKEETTGEASPHAVRKKQNKRKNTRLGISKNCGEFWATISSHRAGKSTRLWRGYAIGSRLRLPVACTLPREIVAHKSAAKRLRSTFGFSRHAL